MQGRFSRCDALDREEKQEEEEGQDEKSLGGTSHDAVIPGKDRELIETCDEVPTRCDVPGDEDAQGQDREGVHSIELLSCNHA